MSLLRMPELLGTARTAGSCASRKCFRDVTSLSSLSFRPPKSRKKLPKTASKPLKGLGSTQPRRSAHSRLHGQTGWEPVSVTAAPRKVAHRGKQGGSCVSHPVLAFKGANLAAGLFLVTLRLIHTLPHHLLRGFPFMHCGLRREDQAAAECSSGCSPGATCRFSHTARF